MPTSRALARPCALLLTLAAVLQAALAGDPGQNPPADPYPGCSKIFDGQSFRGWEADPSTWSLVDGAMRGVGGTSRLAYTTADHGSFRLIFTARMAPVNGDHLGVLFWGDRPKDPSKPKIDNAGWIQFMPPFGGMWDYHPPKHHNLPHETIAKGARDSTRWSTTELLCNLDKGTLRAAVDGVEIVRYTHPTPAERQDPEAPDHPRPDRPVPPRRGRVRIQGDLSGGQPEGGPVTDRPMTSGRNAGLSPGFRPSPLSFPREEFSICGDLAIPNGTRKRDGNNYWSHWKLTPPPFSLTR